MEAGEEHEGPRVAPTYEHACMRAELLGLPRPTREEYEASKLAIRSANYDEEELEELQRQRHDVDVVEPPEAELVEVQLTVSRPRLSASSRVGGPAGPRKIGSLGPFRCKKHQFKHAVYYIVQSVW
jgi:hypothetical protein